MAVLVPSLLHPAAPRAHQGEANSSLEISSNFLLPGWLYLKDFMGQLQKVLVIQRRRREVTDLNIQKKKCITISIH